MADQEFFDENCCACRGLCGHTGGHSYCKKHQYNDGNLGDAQPITLGWICPKCGAVYSPNTAACFQCNGFKIT